MNFGSGSSIPGPSGQVVDTQHVQKKLHSLLQQLSWSYVALWSFNPHLRVLEWTGGHFKEGFSTDSNSEVWSGHLFNLQKACVFTPSHGSVGIAYTEHRNIWRNGPLVHSSVGSEVQAQILKYAGIETAVYIPLAESVLELGTCDIVAEDVELMESIFVFMWENNLPALGHAQEPWHVSQPPLAATSLAQSSPDPLSINESSKHLSQDFELNEQTRRELELGQSSSLLKEPRWRSLPTTLRPTDILQTQKPPLLAATNQALMRFQIYRSHSGTTSSSLNSLEDSSVKLSADSPEQSISLMASSSRRHNSPSYASSSARRETPSRSPDIQLGDTTGIAASPEHLHDIQQAFSYILDEREPQGPWPQMYMDPSLETGNLHAFNEWRHTHVLQRRERSINQGLLRRSIEFMSEIQQRRQSRATVQNLPRPMSSSNPETLPEHDPLGQVGPSRVHRRPRGEKRAGTPGSAAARHHVISERNRRLREKEYLADLRKLLPIISKNDKASTLADASIYLKGLLVEVQDLQADKAEIESRYEKLKLSHQELEQRNKQLEDLVTATSSEGGGPVHPSP